MMNQCSAIAGRTAALSRMTTRVFPVLQRYTTVQQQRHDREATLRAFDA